MNIAFRRTFLFFSLFIFWMILVSDFNTRQIISGIIISAFSVYASEKIFKKVEVEYLKMIPIWRIFWFLIIVVSEIFIAAYKHIIRIIRGDDLAEIFDVELNVTNELSIALISNAITLTPGTMTLRIYGNKITVLGFASSEEEVEDAKDTILNKFQKPFLGV